MKPLAVVTLVRNEPFFLPRWLEYYGRIPDASLHVLDHESDDGSTSDIENTQTTRTVVHHPEMERAAWMLQIVQDKMRSLLASGHRRVIYAEVDEFLIPDPERWSSLDAFLEQNDSDQIGAIGWNVVYRPDDPPLPEVGSLLRGRTWRREPLYDMTLVASHVPHWRIGRHGLQDRPNNPDCGLRLVHLHYIDPTLGWQRIRDRNRNKPYAQDGCGHQNKPADREAFDSHWAELCAGGEPIPENYWNIL